ncbi:DNA mismatch repair protein MutS [Dyadobacter sp. CECT 9275]|uniref:DNA mismatch repair protein MutS n=1 Tax=Dyadobacter helix TaxID=2822344 RepID=A0A916NET8_9BACT|nr:DNA mismatch repair protein MutS [Dyadobacter sp. CECT 9275]CAG5018912.1 DNA mismatch repair protein MutS [Dyadobacter sp. CECT 9275]
MDIYKIKIQEYHAAAMKLEKVINTLSIFRLLSFVLSVAVIMVLANARSVGLLLLVAPLCMLGFALLIKRYNRLFYLKQHTTFLKQINEEEVLRQENKLSGFETGQTFLKRDHAYVSDLDIFGTHSLFQLINRTTTETGQGLLATWLSEPAPKNIIAERQEIIRELSPELEWRQDFQASGMHSSNTSSDYNKLLEWIEKPVKLLPQQTKYICMGILLSLISTAAAVYFIYGLFADHVSFSVTHAFPLIISLLINKFTLKRIDPVTEEVILGTQDNVKILKGYQSLIAKIEGGKFQSGALVRLQSAFSHNGYSAVKEIHKLRKILEIFQQKGHQKPIGGNTFYAIFNLLWLSDIYLILLAEKWKYKNRNSLKIWAPAVSAFEALSSLAGFAYSNPSFSFPQITEEPYVIDFEMLGHPLLRQERRVCNDFSLAGRGEIAMITGSNMAGKSTFLRTVGLNLVLALMGAPCCARSGRVSHMKVFSSMRTQDNLEEGVSSFYAELKKIEQLLKSIESGEPIFFLLDEMFKGTNSQDRYKGGVSLIRQLNELNAFGIISTHDLELAKLSGRHMIVANFSFNSEIRGGEMIFHYKLTEGICTDFNASELMRKSGIKILSDIEKA